MSWAIDPYGNDADTLIAQKEMIQELRRKRKGKAAGLLKTWVAGLALPMPWAQAVESWGEVARAEMVSEVHMGRGGGPLPGFGEIWLRRELGALGYRVEGGRTATGYAMTSVKGAGGQMFQVRAVDENNKFIRVPVDKRILTAPQHI